MGKIRFAVIGRSRPSLLELGVRCMSNSTQRHSQEDTCFSSTVKPFSEIPGPKGLPVVGSLLDAWRGGVFRGQIHQYLENGRKKYGPIFKQEFGGNHISVNLFDPEDIEGLFRMESETPMRFDIPSWRACYQDKGIPNGLTMANGKEWQRQRTTCNHGLLRTPVINNYTPALADVASDFTDVLKDAVKTEDTLDVQKMLFKWSMESTCRVLFNQRVGCLEDKNTNGKLFVQNVLAMLDTTGKLLFVPPNLIQIVTPSLWKEHCDAWENIHKIAHDFIDAQLSSFPHGNETDSDSFLNGLQQDLSLSEVYSAVTEIMIAGVDTTSTTVLWALYELSKNPKKQEEIYNDINLAAKQTMAGNRDGKGIKQRDKHLKHLNAVVKETLRLYPVAPILSRIHSGEIVIRGYRIPAGTIINVVLTSIGRNTAFYPNPDDFQPERWLRLRQETQNETHERHPFAHLPFGFGARSCIGRRVAVLQMVQLLSKLIESFKIEPASDEVIKPKVELLLTPERTVYLKLIRRSNPDGTVK